MALRLNVMINLPAILFQIAIGQFADPVIIDRRAGSGCKIERIGFLVIFFRTGMACGWNKGQYAGNKV